MFWLLRSFYLGDLAVKVDLSYETMLMNIYVVQAAVNILYNLNQRKMKLIHLFLCLKALLDYACY